MTRWSRSSRDLRKFSTNSRLFTGDPDILYGIDNIKKALGAVGWAAKHTKMVGNQLAVQSKKAEDTTVLRKRAVARLASMVHQIDKHLWFLMRFRNVLREAPHVEDAFTTVIAGYPNVGNSSFIRRVSSAEPQVALYRSRQRALSSGTGRWGGRRSSSWIRPYLTRRRRAEPDRAAGARRDDECRGSRALHP